MFLGHFAVGLAAKKVSPSTPLPLVIAAGQLVDLLWPLFLLLGLESVAIDPGDTPVTPLDFISYPYTHSLVATIWWGLLAGGVVYAFRKNAREALVVGLVVVSHWFLDLVSHRPDLPLSPWSESMTGFGLWYHPVPTYLVEFGSLIGGMLAYRTIAHPQSVRRAWVFVAVLGVFYLGNVFGPPPPSASAIAVAGNAMWLFVFWAWWIERVKAQPS